MGLGAALGPSSGAARERGGRWDPAAAGAVGGAGGRGSPPPPAPPAPAGHVGCARAPRLSRGRLPAADPAPRARLPARSAAM